MKDDDPPEIKKNRRLINYFTRAVGLSGNVTTLPGYRYNATLLPERPWERSWP